MKPTFVVTIAPKSGTLPPDTRVNFQYGGGDESFQLGVTPQRRVVFCETYPALSDSGAGGADGQTDSTSQAGAGGAASPENGAVTEIVCEVFTGGSTDVDVTAEGFLDVEDHTLRTERDLCTVSETIELLPERVSSARFRLTSP